MLRPDKDVVSNRPKKIDEDYQARIDAFIKQNGVTHLASTDNKIADGWTKQCEGSKRVSKRLYSKDRLNETILNRFKDALHTGEVVSDFKSLGFSDRNTMANYVSVMRKAGWQIETLPSVGYRLIKSGGLVRWVK